MEFLSFVLFIAIILLITGISMYFDSGDIDLIILSVMVIAVISPMLTYLTGYNKGVVDRESEIVETIKRGDYEFEVDTIITVDTTTVHNIKFK